MNDLAFSDTFVMVMSLYKWVQYHETEVLSSAVKKTLSSEIHFPRWLSFLLRLFEVRIPADFLLLLFNSFKGALSMKHKVLAVIIV